MYRKETRRRHKSTPVWPLMCTAITMLAPRGQGRENLLCLLKLQQNRHSLHRAVLFLPRQQVLWEAAMWLLLRNTQSRHRLCTQGQCLQQVLLQQLLPQPRRLLTGVLQILQLILLRQILHLLRLLPRKLGIPVIRQVRSHRKPQMPPTELSPPMKTPHQKRAGRGLRQQVRWRPGQGLRPQGRAFCQHHNQVLENLR